MADEEKYRYVPAKDLLCTHEGLVSKTDENGKCPICGAISLVYVKVGGKDGR